MTTRSNKAKQTPNIRPGTAKQKIAQRPWDDRVLTTARRLGRLLRGRGWMCACAESCTGGKLSQIITAVPGSSGWFERGFVTYSNLSKIQMLGLSAGTIARHGAVSEAAARAMAEGALRASAAQIAVAITGIAGPGGGRPGKPVGTVFLAFARTGDETKTERHWFRGGRQAVRRAAVLAALEGLCKKAGN
jgi:nicotinamide-nucleotide amidase